MSSFADTLALLAVLVLGVPHGAADAGLAMQTRLADSRAKLCVFMLGYGAVAALIVALWMAYPLPTLALFFLLTVFHFGRGDALAFGTSHMTARAFVHGGFIIMIVIAHEVETMAYFYRLTDADAWPVITMLRLLALIWIAAFGVAIMRDWLTPAAIIEIMALTILAFMLPPLPAFAIYFCAIHSRRHFLRLMANPHINTKTNLRLALAITLISLAAISMAAFFINPMQFTDGLLRSLFIALAALTVPHMLLIDAMALPRPAFEEHQYESE